MRARWWCAAVMIAALVAVTPSPAHAIVTYVLRGSVLGNGGEFSNNATRVMRATVGQAAIGIDANATRILCSGFWCFGGSRVVAVDDGDGGGAPGGKLPKELAFGAPSPNPSRGDVRFTLALPQDADVTFSVFDVAGRQLGEAVTERMNAGYHQLHWSAPSDHSGVYFGVLRVDGRIQGERRIVLVR